MSALTWPELIRMPTAIGQVVGRAGFLEVGGGKVNHDARAGEKAAGIADSRAHAFRGFIHGRIR